jgi:hypothetical protein
LCRGFLVAAHRFLQQLGSLFSAFAAGITGRAAIAGVLMIGEKPPPYMLA